MKVSDIDKRVKRAFGDESGVEIDSDDILRWVNDAALDIARRTESVQRVSEVPAVAGTSTYPVPSDFLFFKRATYNGRLLSSIPFQVLDSMFPHRDADSPRGTPEYVTVSGRNFVVYPAPDVTGAANLDLTYVARPTTVTTGDDVPEVPEEFHEAIVRFCFMRAKEQDEDWSAARAIAESYESMVVGARHDAQTQQADAYPVVRDDPGDY